MAQKDWRDYAESYFKRFASPEPILPIPAVANGKMIIVIPCHNEPDLMGTLESLIACNKPEQTTEVIVVVNHSENAAQTVKDQNQQTIQEFNQWNADQRYPLLQFFLIKALDLPPKHAGVGLARKIGMDEALRRFVATGYDGPIVCLDADCRVTPNYLQVIESDFANSEAGLGEMHYEHPYESEADDGLRIGIINYELFLRYYVEGLKQAGFPNAIQTVGSCMLVKASVYAKHGGMNKRKAGEDFYFLHKIIPHEAFKTVTRATVFPSCRTSDRVPFGTGKAQLDWLERKEDEYLTYDPIIFQELKGLLKAVGSFFQEAPEQVTERLPQSSQDFLLQHGCQDKIRLIQNNTKDLAQFKKQFFIWFDGFMCMKYVHFLRDHFYPNKPIEKAASQLLSLEEMDARDLLEHYRFMELQG